MESSDPGHSFSRRFERARTVPTKFKLRRFLDVQSTTLKYMGLCTRMGMFKPSPPSFSSHAQILIHDMLCANVAPKTHPRRVAAEKDLAVLRDKIHFYRKSINRPWREEERRSDRLDEWRKLLRDLNDKVEEYNTRLKERHDENVSDQTVDHAKAVGENPTLQMHSESSSETAEVAMSMKDQELFGSTEMDTSLLAEALGQFELANAILNEARILLESEFEALSGPVVEQSKHQEPLRPTS